MNIKYCLKTKVVGACVWDTPHTSGGALGQQTSGLAPMAFVFLFSLFYLSSSIYMPSLLDFQSNPSICFPSYLMHILLIIIFLFKIIYKIKSFFSISSSFNFFSSLIFNPHSFECYFLFEIIFKINFFYDFILRIFFISDLIIILFIVIFLLW